MLINASLFSRNSGLVLMYVESMYDLVAYFSYGIIKTYLARKVEVAIFSFT